ncbi:MAG: 16S rRNA (uracil(1498)-N(3))-methyltransferase [Bacteroidia bacterium]|nr:16S rRNA (uracil(1498)-N(3))-methyltransferase [Bacteroidia bacterium]
MHLFYVPDISPGWLPPEESHHCIQVMRLKVGDEIYLSDGVGTLYRAVLQNEHPKKCAFEIREQWPGFQKRNYAIHLAIAPPKNTDRLEWLVEKSVELGVDEISFLRCERSERKQIKTDRLEKVAISAMKQSLKTYLPQIRDMISFDKFVETLAGAPDKFIAWLPEEPPEHLLQKLVPGRSYCILVGPEGDFSPREVECALKNGFQSVSLGISRLRTETAGIVACHLCHLKNEVKSDQPIHR